MSAKVVICNGWPASGKTTFENYCKDWLGEQNFAMFSTVDLVKELASKCGWMGEKTPEARKFLSDFKYFLSDTYLGDITFNDVCHKINNVLFRYEQCDVEPNVVFFVDAREPEQIKRFKEELGAITVLIRNDKAEQVAASNSADSGVFGCDYDYVISNNGTLAELKEKARIFCSLVRG